MSITALILLSLSTAQPNVRDQPTAEPIQLSLEDAVEVGAARSFRIQRSDRNERMSGERLRSTKGLAGPRVDVNLGANQSQRYYDFKGNFDYNQAEPSFLGDANAIASYDLDISGVQKRMVRQARLSRESSKIELDQATLDVSTDIRTTYVGALRAQRQVKVDADYVTLIGQLIERARASQPTVIPFLESERLNAVQSLEGSRTSADLALSNLRQILRFPRDQQLELTTELANPQPLPSIDRLLELAVENRNDLKQSQIRLQQARIAKVQATDSRKPSMRASAFATQSYNGDTFTLNGDNHGRTRNAAAVLSFNLPLFQYDGGSLAANRNIANIQAEQALADADGAEERAETEINQVLIGLNSADERLKRLPDVGQSRQSLAQAEAQLLSAPANVAPALLAQVTNARQNWRSSVISRSDARTDYYANYYRLQRSIGTEQVR
jgi:outer membrane protein TolC